MKDLTYQRDRRGAEDLTELKQNSKLCLNSLRHWRGTLRASLSGTFLQTLPELVTPLEGHTPSLAFRHFPPNSARTGYATEGAHSEHCFPALSSKLCQNWLRCQHPPKGLGTNNTLSPVLPQ